MSTDTENTPNAQFGTPSDKHGKATIMKLLNKPKSILSDLTNSPKTPRSGLTPTKSGTPRSHTKLSKKHIAIKLSQLEQENTALRSEVDTLRAQLIQAQVAQEYAESDQAELKRKNTSLTAENKELQDKVEGLKTKADKEVLERWRSFCSKQNSPPGTTYRQRGYSNTDVE